MAYLYDLTDTWNAAGTVFNAIKMNVTNSASAVGSKIVSLQVGSTDRFTVDKDGNGYLSGTLQVVGSVSSPNVYISGNSGTIGMQDNTASILAYNGTGSGGITNALRFITAASERMRIDSSGNVGIGTSSPSSYGKVTVNGSVILGAPSGRNTAATNYIGTWTTGDPADDARANIGFTTVAGGASSSSYITFATNNYGVSGGERMRIDQSGNVGIGTTSPSAQLDSFKASGYNDIRVRSGSNQTYLAADGTNAYVGTYSNIPLLVSTNNTERMRVTAGGDVGIGTSVPDVKVSIQDAGAGQITLKDSGGTTRAYIMTNGAIGTAPTNSLRIRGDSGVALGAVGSLAMFIDTSNNVGVGTSSPSNLLHIARSSGNAILRVQDTSSTSDTFYISNSSGTSITQTGALSMIFGTSNTERMRIDQSGNVGIGTSSPGGGANDRVVLASGSSSAVFQTNGGSISTQFGSTSAGYGYVNVTTNNALLFFTNNTERMRLDTSGNLLVGTTSAVGTLTVNAPASTSAAYLQNQTTATWTTRIVNTGATGDNYLVLFETDTNSQRGSVTYNRTAGLIQYNTTSDYRAKTIHGPVEDVGSTVDALKVYNGTMHGATQSRPMLVAHEAQEVAPYAVFGEKDAVNPDGTPAYQSIDVSALVPLLIAEIQSLRARVAQLEGN